MEDGSASTIDNIKLETDFFIKKEEYLDEGLFPNEPDSEEEFKYDITGASSECEDWRNFGTLPQSELAGDSSADIESATDSRSETPQQSVDIQPDAQQGCPAKRRTRAQKASPSSDLLRSCRICGDKFITITRMVKHAKRQHAGEKPFKCEVCSKTYKTLTYFYVHQNSHDPRSDSPAEPRHKVRKARLSGMAWSCHICGQKFWATKTMTKHVKRQHGGEKPFKCETCGKTYETVSCFNTHQNKHSLAKAYTCDVCGKSFLRKDVLSRHRITHDAHRPRPHQCNVCEKTFGSTSDLKRHRGIHLPDKPFNCGECGKSFVQKGDLAKHCLIHTKVKPFKCKICQQQFNRRDVLKKHLLTHTGERPYQCKYCDYSCARRDVLIIHEKYHTGQNLLRCDNCDATFATKASMAVHARMSSCHRPRPACTPKRPAPVNYVQKVKIPRGSKQN